MKSFLPQETPSGNLGDDIMLTCGTVTRHVNYTWFKGGHVIDHGAETTVRLRADQDFGDYTCFASNKAGNSSRKISVRKKAKEGNFMRFLFSIVNRYYPFHSQISTNQKSTFSQPCKERCISEVVRIGTL